MDDDFDAVLAQAMAMLPHHIATKLGNALREQRARHDAVVDATRNLAQLVEISLSPRDRMVYAPYGRLEHAVGLLRAALAAREREVREAMRQFRELRAKENDRG